MQKGISREIILAKAIEIIEKTRNPAISMREIAEESDTKTPSLYNHVKGMNELYTDISGFAKEHMVLFFSVPAVGAEPAFINPDSLKHIIHTVKAQAGEV